MSKQSEQRTANKIERNIILTLLNTKLTERQFLFLLSAYPAIHLKKMLIPVGIGPRVGIVPIIRVIGKRKRLIIMLSDSGVARLSVHKVGIY